VELGFDDVGIGSERRRLAAIRFRTARTEHDHGQILPARADLAQQREAIHHWHVQIGEHRVWPLQLEHSKRRAALGRYGHQQPSATQHLAQQITNDRRIIDDEHTPLAPRFAGWRGSGRPRRVAPAQ